MANPLTDSTQTGTLGELLVQLRLLQYGIQAAPPIKDSGNDLIGIKGRVVKFIQVKTRSAENLAFNTRGLKNRDFDLLFLVTLARKGNEISFDNSIIDVLTKEDFNKGNYRNLDKPNRISNERINVLWS